MSPIIIIAYIAVLIILVIIGGRDSHKKRSFHSELPDAASRPKKRADSSKELILSEARADYKIEVYSFIQYKRKWNSILVQYPAIGAEDWSIRKAGQPSGDIAENYDLQTGDIDFDRMCHITGDADVLRSLLNVKIRKEISMMYKAQVGYQISTDSFKCKIDNKHVYTAEKMENLIQKIIRLTDLLNDSSDMFTNCMDNVLNDPVPKVRMYNLGILASRFADREETRAMIKKSFSDPEMDVSIYAATLAGGQGLPVLEQFLAKKELTSQQLHEIIAQFVSQEYTAAIPALVKKYEDQNSLSKTDKLSILQGIRGLADTSAQDFLCSQLEIEEDATIRIALLDSLGSCGDVKALGFLYKWQEPRSTTGHRDTIKKIMEKIKSRLDLRGEKGWLSLDDNTETQGGLSLSQGDEGGLSMAEED